MGQYRIRKAKPGETPGYYSREQLGMRRFAAGGFQEEEDNSPNLSQMLPQLTNMIATSVLQDPDPENADIRPMMSQLAQQLTQSGVDPTVVQELVSAAGKQALSMVANLIDKQEQEKAGTPEGDVTDNTVVEEEEAPDVEGAANYGYYDANPGMAEDADENAAMDDVMFGSNAALQNQMRYGGASGKRKFMKESMNYLAKAAEGMQQQMGNKAALRGTADDIQGKTLTSKDTFIPAVKQTAQNEVNKKFAEEQYNNMMSQKFQFGGSNRKIRRANAAMFGTPFAPPGANASYNFGPLGGLRSASVEFDPRMLQTMFGATSVMPGMISGQSGWYTPSYQIKGTRVKSSSETPAAQEAKSVNSEAMAKVAKDTPNSDATSDARTIEQMRADALKNAGYDASGGSGGWAAGTANSELNQGTNGNGTSGGNGASGTNRSAAPNPVRTPNPVVQPNPIVPTPKPVTKTKSTIKKGNEVIIPGKPFVYHKTSDGKWHFEDNKGKHGYVTNEKTIKDLNAGKFKLKSEWVKESTAKLNNIRPITGMDPGNPNDFMGQYVLPFIGFPGAGAGAVDEWANFQFKQPNRLGPGQNGLNSGQGMLNPGQKMLNPPAGHQFSLGFADGGAINPNLYEYGFGGSDITQDDMDYTQSKDVSDPYFRDGGLYRFAGEEDSEVAAGQNAGLTKEDVQKMFDEYGKKMQTQYGQQQYGQQQQFGSFGSAGINQPMWGRPTYARGYNANGMFGQYGNMFAPYTRDFKYYSPYTQGKPGNTAINANALMAGSLANIQKSGMLPTKVTYSKERKQDGNFFERKLGFNKDRITTIDYAAPGTKQPLGLPNTWNQNKQPAAGAGPIGQGAAPGAQQSMNPQEYMHSQLAVPSQQGTPGSSMPAGFPANNVGPVNTEMAYGGYMPMAYAYGGDVPEYQIAGEINNQAGNQPSAIPYWVTNPIGSATNNIMGGCTDEQKKDPNSPCYEKQTEQIKLKENTAGTIHYDNIMNGAVAGARSFVNNANDLQGMSNTYVPETQKMIYDRMTPQQRKYTGKWEENSGQQNKMGFEGVVKKGGTTGLKENGEYQLTMDEIQHILRSGGKIEFL
jgi:hypothetical protein